MDGKSQYKGQEYDGLREMVKAIKKSLGPKRVSSRRGRSDRSCLKIKSQIVGERKRKGKGNSKV